MVEDSDAFELSLGDQQFMAVEGILKALEEKVASLEVSLDVEEFGTNLDDTHAAVKKLFEENIKGQGEKLENARKNYLSFIKKQIKLINKVGEKRGKKVEELNKKKELKKALEKDVEGGKKDGRTTKIPGVKTNKQKQDKLEGEIKKLEGEIEEDYKNMMNKIKNVDESQFDRTFLQTAWRYTLGGAWKHTFVALYNKISKDDDKDEAVNTTRVNELVAGLENGNNELNQAIAQQKDFLQRHRNIYSLDGDHAEEEDVFSHGVDLLQTQVNDLNVKLRTAINAQGTPQVDKNKLNGLTAKLEKSSNQLKKAKKDHKEEIEQWKKKKEGGMTNTERIIFAVGGVTAAVAGFLVGGSGSDESDSKDKQQPKRERIFSEEEAQEEVEV